MKESLRPYRPGRPPKASLTVEANPLHCTAAKSSVNPKTRNGVILFYCWGLRLPRFSRWRSLSVRLERLNFQLLAGKLIPRQASADDLPHR
jgi:hypothetical protein